MGLCEREKHPIIGRRGSWNTSKKSEMAFICLRQEFNRIYLEQTSAVHLLSQFLRYTHCHFLNISSFTCFSNVALSYTILMEL